VTERQRREWERVAQHPRSVRFEELQHLLETSGWALARVHGSHHSFTKGGAILTVPRRTPHVLPIYVRQVLAVTRPSETED
jgi:predicted RNA binding protein YcfA (HicA-like mRNA interferase family)